MTLIRSHPFVVDTAGRIITHITLNTYIQRDKPHKTKTTYENK